VQTTINPIQAMEGKTLTHQQSLEVIREMIQRSQQKFSQHAGIFLTWGWAIIIAALTTYLYFKLGWTFNLYIIWIVAIGVPGLWTAYSGFTRGREATRHAVSPIDTYMAALWGGSSGVFIILMLIGITYSWVVIYPLIIAVYGWGVLVSGVLMNFRPLVLGGISNFFIAGVAVFVTSEAILLLLIAALVCSYLIPGYMLKYSDK